MKYLIITAGFVFLISFVSCKNEPAKPDSDSPGSDNVTSDLDVIDEKADAELIKEVSFLENEFRSNVDASLVSVSIDGAKEYFISGKSGKQYSLKLSAEESRKIGNPKNLKLSLDKASVKRNLSLRKASESQKFEKSNVKTEQVAHGLPIGKIKIDQVNGKPLRVALPKLELTPWEIPLDSIPQYHEKWHITKIAKILDPGDSNDSLHLWRIHGDAITDNDNEVFVQHAIFEDEVNTFLEFSIDSLNNHNHTNPPGEPDIEIKFYFHWATESCAESYCDIMVSENRATLDGQNNRALLEYYDNQTDNTLYCLFGSASSLLHEHMHHLGIEHDCFHQHHQNIQN